MFITMVSLKSQTQTEKFAKSISFLALQHVDCNPVPTYPQRLARLEKSVIVPVAKLPSSSTITIFMCWHAWRLHAVFCWKYTPFYHLSYVCGCKCVCVHVCVAMPQSKSIMGIRWQPSGRFHVLDVCYCLDGWPLLWSTWRKDLQWNHNNRAYTVTCWENYPGSS